jgi:hypothetical protein
LTGAEDRALVWNSWKLSVAGFLAAKAAKGSNEKSNELKILIVKLMVKLTVVEALNESDR